MTSTLMPASAIGPRIAYAIARLVGHAADRDLRFVALRRDPGHQCFFHCHVRIFLERDERARLPLLPHRNRRVGEARQHARRHFVFAGEFHRADLQHLRARARHLEHFLESDRPQAPRPGNDARIGCVDAVHVGEDLAFVGAERRRHGDCRRIRSTAPERGDVSIAVNALVAGDDRDAPFLQVPAHALLVDRHDARAGERFVGEHLHLPSGVAARWNAELEQRHREQPDGDLLAGRGDHVQLARVRDAPGLRGRARSAGSSRRPSPTGTTIRSCPAAFHLAMRFATLRIRSIEPTDVPPYFWTMSAMRARSLPDRNAPSGKCAA
jgi:hypothetical protein